MPLAPLARQKLGRHLDKSNMAGELAFLKSAGQFERPYGYAWILKLAAELADWNDPDAKKWSANIAPLADWTAKEMTQFLTALERPNRGGAHPNTAFAMYMMLDYVESTKDEALRAAIHDSAKRFYATDKNCDTKSEPAGTDFLSPCLTEAALMSRVMDRPAFLAWFDGFLPAMHSAEFKPFTEPVDTTGITRPDRLAGKSHLIGLAFQRAVVMNRLAHVLPEGDLRVGVLSRLAAVHGVKGMQGMHDAGYFGSHWLGHLRRLLHGVATAGRRLPGDPHLAVLEITAIARRAASATGRRSPKPGLLSSFSSSRSLGSASRAFSCSSLLRRH